MDTDRDQFGESRLIELIKRNLDKPASGLVGKIVEGVRTHAGEAPQYDDITALVVKRQSK